MIAPQRVMEIALQNEYSLSSKLRKRYSELLVARAVRFYIENELNSAVVFEDLYHGEDFDCSCSYEDADKNKHKSSCEYSKKIYPNLDYSETHEKEYQRSLKENTY